MRKIKTTYFTIIFFIFSIVLYISGISFSLLIINKNLNASVITIANLNYLLSSSNSEFSNGEVTVPAGETLIINLELKSLNRKETRYALNYESLSSDVKVYYSENLKNNMTGVIGDNGCTIDMRVVIVNSSDSEQIIALKVSGGYLKNTIISNITEGYYESNQTIRYTVYDENFENSTLVTSVPDKDDYSLYYAECTNDVTPLIDEDNWEFGAPEDEITACDFYFKKAEDELEIYYEIEDIYGQSTFTQNKPDTTGLYTNTSYSCSNNAVYTFDANTFLFDVSSYKKNTLCIANFTTNQELETADKYTIAFYDDDSIATSKEVISGGTYGDLPEITKANYDFLGWYTNLDDGIEVTNTTNLITEGDHNLYAKWDKVESNETFDFSAQDSEIVFEAPYDGEYKLEAWGAQGGSFNTSCIGGYGAYATGVVELQKGDKLYINVGGAGSGDGTHTYQAGGYNGGGDANTNTDGNTRNASGGGATSIALVSGLLSTLENEQDKILLVAAGGGGTGGNSSGNVCTNSGSGGGITGNTSNTFSGWGQTVYSTGGTQTAGGSFYANLDTTNYTAYFAEGSFGMGGSVVSAGGGGGLYGGGASEYVSGGGSSYIGNTLLSNKIMYCYNCETSTEKSTKTITTTNVSEDAISNYAKSGAGAVKITYVNEYTYDFTNNEEEFDVLKDGTYKIEAWGAQGGSYPAACSGGYGAYASGTLELKKGDTLYLNVGGAGSGDGTHKYQEGGYNGGGNANVNSDGNTRNASGGGASSIALVSGLLSTLESEKDKILLVASGGGGSAGNSHHALCSNGGNGGGITGNDGSAYTIPYSSIGYGATQTTGGKYYYELTLQEANYPYFANGSFGLGGSAICSGGGGGIYGGGVGEYSSGGGSSYIGNILLTNKVVYCYNCKTSSNISTKTKSITKVSSDATSSQAKSGNGYIVIRRLKGS